MSSRIQNLSYVWSLPDRTEERTQVTLRLTYDLYAKLHALKAIYPGRSVNDIICDLLTVSIDDLVESFPVEIFTEADFLEELEQGVPAELISCSVGKDCGLTPRFKAAYRRILESKEGSSNE